MKMFVFKRRIMGAWRSLTVWLNVLVITLLPIYEVLKSELPSLQVYMTPETYKWAGLVLAVTNIALRFKTTKDLANK